MNITEANELNVVLRYFLRLPVEGGAEDARDAAAWLADRANAALHSGLTGSDVRAAWPCDDPDCTCDEVVDEPPRRPIDTIQPTGDTL